MTKRPSFGIFHHNEKEFIGWLQMMSPLPVCEGSRFRQTSGFSACCQLHAVEDCLAHAAEDLMNDEDRITCILASEYLQAGKGVKANGLRLLPPNWSIDNEVEN